MAFTGILEPEIVGEGAKKPDGAFAQRATRFGAELVSLFTTTFVSSQTPYKYDRAKAHKSSDSCGHESELF